MMETTMTATGPLLACSVADLPEGEAKHIPGDPAIGIFHTEDGEIFAVDDVCTHAYALLTEGDIDGDTVECPLHMGKFDLRTGQPRCFPATRAVRAHKVEVSDGNIYVHVGVAPDASEA